MIQLSEKELSALNDLLSEEEMLVKKFKMLAQHAQEPKIQNEMEEIAQKHQGHFNLLYRQLG